MKLAPPQAFRDDTLKYFTDFRKTIMNAVMSQQMNGCGGTTLGTIKDAISAGKTPETSDVVGLDAVTASRALEVVADLFQECDLPSVSLSQWCFAVLARVEEPLNSDDQWQIQCIRRKCEGAWTKLEESSPELAPVNLLHVVCFDYFKQR